MENCTVSSSWNEWESVSFDDSKWPGPTPLPADAIPTPVPLAPLASAATSRLADLKQVQAGTLSERLGYSNDDPPARFALRELTPDGATATGLDYGASQGKWRRFGALRCQLLRVAFQIQAPAGTVLEVGYSQALIDGKVLPWHPLTGGRTCYMDRYTVGTDMANKPFILTLLEPRGGRYIELHALLDDDSDSLEQILLPSPSQALYRSYGPNMEDRRRYHT